MQVLLQFLLLSCAQKYRERSQHHVRDNQWERERETWTAHGNTIDSIDSSTDVARKWRSTRKLGGGRAGCGFHGCLHSSSLVAAARPVAMLSLLEIGVMVLHADAMMFFGFEESWRFFRKRFCNACVSCMCIKIVHWPARRLRWAKTELVSMLILLHLVASCCARIIQLLLAIGWLWATAVFRKYLHFLQLETNWG